MCQLIFHFSYPVFNATSYISEVPRGRIVCFFYGLRKKHRHWLQVLSSGHFGSSFSGTFVGTKWRSRKLMIILALFSLRFLLRF